MSLNDYYALLFGISDQSHWSKVRQETLLFFYNLVTHILKTKLSIGVCVVIHHTNGQWESEVPYLRLGVNT